jgi:hypothetical protein
MKAPPLSTTLLCLALTGQVFGDKVIPNHAIADLVLGQPDFNTATVLLTTSSFAFSYPTAVVVDPVTRKVFVSDFGNDRVLRFSSAAALVNENAAEAVLGQPSFISNTSGVTQSRMSLPGGLFLDHLGRLWVADTFNNRVIMFKAASSRGSLPTADMVLGQPNFITKTVGTTNTRMNEPLGVWVDSSDTLWVADSGNNRILRFNTVSNNPIQNSAADAVLGQANFTTGTPGSGVAGLNNPTSLAVSGNGALFVACANDNRVLRFDNALSLPSGLNNASAVLGQLNLTDTGAGLSAALMNKPYGVTITPDDTLWVVEGGNHRAIRFVNASTLNSGAAANGVVGQPNFITNANSTTNRGLYRPLYAPFVDATGSLWVSDDLNNRILRFPPDVTRPLLTVTSTVPERTLANEQLIKGTASDAYGVTKVQYRIGSGALKTASGSTGWQFVVPLVIGNNIITIFATDTVGNTSLVKTIKIERADDSIPPDLTKPLLTVTTSVPEKTFKNEQLIQGTAKDASGIKKVQFRVGTGDLKTAIGTNSWQCTIPLKLGENKITIFATDTAGNTSLAKTITIERLDDSVPPDLTKPLLTVTTSVPEKTFKNEQLIQGTASDEFGIKKVQFRIDAGDLKTAIGTANWQCTIPLKLGENKIAIFATDSSGNTSLVKTITIERLDDSVPPDLTKPLLTLTTSVPEKTFKNEQLIQGTASDAFGIKKVQFQVDAGDLKTAVGTANWQCTIPLKLGANKIAIFATDSSGNTSLVKTITVERLDDSAPPDLTKPLLKVTSIVPQKTFKKAQLIKGTAKDAFGIKKVQYRVGTGALKTAIGTTNWKFKAKLKLGKNKITIFATDYSGNTSLVKTIRVERVDESISPDVTKPLLKVTSTVPKSTFKKVQLIKGTAKDAFGIKKVQYRVGTGALKTAIGTTNWKFKANLKLGKNKITVFATDYSGNTSLAKTIMINRKKISVANSADPVASSDVIDH